MENWNTCLSAFSGVRIGYAKFTLSGPKGLYHVTPTPTELAIWLKSTLPQPWVVLR